MAYDENKIKNEQNDGDIPGEEKPDISGSTDNLRETAKIADEDKKLDDTISPETIAEHEPTALDRDRDNRENIEKGNIVGILARRPIVIILIIGIIVLGGFLIYTQFQLSNQSYKTENYDALWNQSLLDLRSGNASINEYCNNRVHDEELCSQFKNLQYMG
ncbi:MAG TPA: hypothetical protein VE548_13265 [Nitrososphaeraceae archaeon]|jgi:hypothetical protein|nr:hypothetical protein [Nitrososphaeraceae archaeon]